MTRALTSQEVRSLENNDTVARIRAVGEVETGTVAYTTATQVVVEWPSEEGFVRYARETGRRLGCHGEVLRAVPEMAPVHDGAVAHTCHDLGSGAANVEPNDEAQIVASVKRDRARAKKLSEQQWLDEVREKLDERLGWENATPAEREALQKALSTAGTQPQSILVTELVKRETPYYAADKLVRWMCQQRKARRAQAAVVPDFAQW